MSSLSLLIKTLRVMECVADVSPVPGVKLIISTALAIAETAEVSSSLLLAFGTNTLTTQMRCSQTVKQNKGACLELAERAAKLSLSVCEELRDVEDLELDRSLVRRIAALQ